MENATKALLIAGSVLIAILLIAMGLRIFNSTSETTEQSQKVMDATAVATFNSQFTGYYTGSNSTITKAQTITLLNKVIANNSTNEQHSIKIMAVAGGTGTYEKASEIQSFIGQLTKDTYHIVSFVYSDGYISGIIITPGTGSYY